MVLKTGSKCKRSIVLFIRVLHFADERRKVWTKFRFIFEKGANIYYKEGLFYPAVLRATDKNMMDRNNLCEKCPHKQSCEEVYRQLGKVKGRSVAMKVVAAFLLPIVILICSMAFFQYVLADLIESEGLMTALSLFLALLLTACYILVIKQVNKVKEKG